MNSIVKKLVAIDHPTCAGDGYVGIQKVPHDQLWHAIRYKGGYDRVSREKARELISEMLDFIED